MASTHLYMRVCPSVGWLVGWLVRRSVCRSVGNHFFLQKVNLAKRSLVIILDGSLEMPPPLPRPLSCPLPHPLPPLPHPLPPLPPLHPLLTRTHQKSIVCRLFVLIQNLPECVCSWQEISFQSRTRDSISHSVGSSVSPSVCRSRSEKTQQQAS